MIESKVKEIAASKGIRSSYGLQKALDIAPSNALRLWEGKVTRFSVEILDKLCETFAVSVGDLLVYRQGENDTRNVIQNKDYSISVNTSNVVKTPVTVRTISESAEGMLSTVEVAARLGISRKSVNDYIVKDKLKAIKGKGNHNFVSEPDFLVFETWYLQSREKQ
jgi:DNA-binding Xre family transcriptional regulator/biotin operon repressor